MLIRRWSLTGGVSSLFSDFINGLESETEVGGTDEAGHVSGTLLFFFLGRLRVLKSLALRRGMGFHR